MELVALDLEGSGAQDRDQEAILEIALVPLNGWQPDLTAAYHSLINPGRPIPRRPWLSPGLTTDVLSQAPSLAAVEPEIAHRINGKYLVGHNIWVDWRLLHRRCPSISPAGVIDTLRLARRVRPGVSNSLGALVKAYDLTSTVDQLAPGSVPHRALWDTIAAALLLPILAGAVQGAEPTAADLLGHAENLGGGDPEEAAQPSLFD